MPVMIYPILLTKKEVKTYNTIKNCIIKNNYSPSLREIAREMDIKAVSCVHRHVNSLIQKGYLTRLEDMPNKPLTLIKKI